MIKGARGGLWTALTLFAILSFGALHAALHAGPHAALHAALVPEAQLFSQTAPPQEGITRALLRFQHREGDFVIFYDRAGEPIYLRFRLRRSDTSRDQELRGLSQGMLYWVSYREELSMADPESEKSVSRRIRPQKPLRQGWLVGFQAYIPETMLF